MFVHSLSTNKKDFKLAHTQLACDSRTKPAPAYPQTAWCRERQSATLGMSLGFPLGRGTSHFGHPVALVDEHEHVRAELDQHSTLQQFVSDTRKARFADGIVDWFGVRIINLKPAADTRWASR